NDLKIQQIRVRQIKDDINDAIAVIPQLTIRTPIPGIFQIAWNRRNRTLIKVGDEVYRGNNVGNVPDLTWIKVETYVDETDIFKIKEGQRVNVRLDAIPNLVFPAEISQIGRLCHPKDNNNKQKVFDVELRVLVSDARLKPGMTVSNEFLCEALHDVLFVPLNCVENTASGSYIYIKKGLTYERTEVEAGPMNNTHIVIKGDLEPGQLVAPVNQVEKSDKQSKETA
ncbi:MAG: HlyD family efflux transporter periplasmic adaptor subunit, partial [Bacteroidales bacterium]|nr:HlyD family efflux transporter periplasmic adaptor subunit [Bacteroidales bacterium]